MTHRAHYRQWHKRLGPLCMLLLLTGCEINLAERIVAPTPGSLSASGYFHWAATASDEMRQIELERLQAQTANRQSNVSLVQRAIVLYFMEIGGEDSIAKLNLAYPENETCGANRRCQDYTTFAELFKERAELEAALENSQQSVRNLQDRIRILNQQIEALTNIEQQLLEREQRQN